MTKAHVQSLKSGGWGPFSGGHGGVELSRERDLEMRSSTLASFMALGMSVALSGCGGGAQDATPVTIPVEPQVMVETLPEPGGENCATGGTQIVIGYDQDQDGALEDDEVTSQSYVCAGTNGSDG